MDPLSICVYEKSNVNQAKIPIGTEVSVFPPMDLLGIQLNK